MKDTNPKQAFADGKIPLHLIPPTASLDEALAFLEGAAKYGRCNWRESGVLASTYYAAALRHLNAWFEGEEVALDSGVSHLGHVRACIAIIIDAKAHGKLVDDRNFVPTTEGPGYDGMVSALTSQAKAIRDKYAALTPTHYDKRLNEC